MDVPTDRPSLTFAALAHPTRRAILERLHLGEADVGELAIPFGISQPSITKHLRVLERAGLVATRRDAQRRPRALVAAPLRDVTLWLASFSEAWSGRLESLDSYLQTLQQREGGYAGKK
ncbi:metalloregulator ArsR/SmtB family transcription factor [Ramlibacter sp.]|uniref:ArsR/SmtB family transcription factor n=1 Tax=Ramlibacter sp. TaxID=1917967 RepID=UPI00260FC6D9|nr:metalloregulator ArsR/SmtB family transcription factor [Ramlibacter sp.]